MADLKLKQDVAPKFMEAAKRMFKRLGIDTGELKKPEDVRDALVKSLKAPSSRRFGEAESVRDGGSPRFVFHQKGGVTSFENEGRSHLFISETGAGFAQYAHTDKRAVLVYLFYSDSRGTYEQVGEDLVRDVGGEKRKLKVLPPDYTKTVDDLGGMVIDDLWSDVCKTLMERVRVQEAETVAVLTFTGLEKKK